ncbi:MAG: DNA internalization-related competence protein ComEC/Rec2 [Acidobacteria bacterium]|nr:DNA internalization-related competence protein ComEC/Rec2 [Acidobacteriota bacterium]
MARPLLPVSLACAAGCFAGDATSPWMAVALLALTGALLGLALATREPRAGLAALLGAAAAVGAAASGAERAAHEAALLHSWPDAEDPVRLEGTAVTDGRTSGDRLVLVLDAEAPGGREAGRPAGRVRITVGGATRRPEILAGERVVVWTSLRRVRGFGNPGAEDAEGEARRQGIHRVGYCKSPRLLECHRSARASLRGALARARAWARGALTAALPPGPEEAVVRAMVLGDRSGLDRETGEAFRIAGTYHVLAISGAQVALLAGLLVHACGLAGWSRGASGLVVSVAVALYAAAVGGDPPVVRAAVMAVVLLGGRALDLDADLANLAGLAGLVMLLHRPSSVGDVGLQLSFAATLGILLLTPGLLQPLPRLPLRLDLGLAASLGAQIPLLPLLAAHFHRLAPAAVLLNLLAVPLASAVLVAGLAVLAASVLSHRLAALAGDAAWVAAHALLRTGDVAQLAPALDVRVPAPPLWAVAALAVGTVLLARSRRRGRGLVLCGVGVAGLLVGCGAEADGRLHLTVLDVGQGDALLLRSPGGRAFLVDTGGGFGSGLDFGEAVVGPALWAQGIRTLDRVLLTHAHPDHVGGAPLLVRAFRVGEVWEGPAPRKDRTYVDLDAHLRRWGTTRRTVVRGAALDWDGVGVDVLGPAPPGRPPWRTRNDDSVVVALRLGGVRMLLTGDAEAGGEAFLGALPSAVLKVPHHGSRTSSTAAFVAGVAPRVAIVSVGQRSRFGHPHAEVLERYVRQGVRVFRTDLDGAVTVATDGTTVWVRTFRSGRWEPVAEGLPGPARTAGNRDRRGI